VNTRALAAALAALVLAAALSGCGSGGGLADGASPDGSGGVVDQAVAHSSVLASALDLVPDLPDVSVTFTDWAMLGHRAPTDPGAEPLAQGLLGDDITMKKDLGFGTTSADWEIDLWPRGGRAGTFVLGCDRHTDLAGLAGRLTRFGYRANGPVFTGSFDRRHIWTLTLRNIGIDAGRHLLAGGPDAAAVRSVLDGSGNPLGHADSVSPLLALATARLGRIATASVVVGSGACVRMADILGPNATYAQIAAMRKRFTGTLTPPQAKITALEDPVSPTALDALIFPDHGAAQANRASRMAAAKELNEFDAGGIRVTGSTVTGRVLGFTLAAGQQDDILQGVRADRLGVDICR
jgi:hypothetical protein